MFEGADILTNDIYKLFIVNFIDGATLNIDTATLVIDKWIKLENDVKFAEKATLFQCIKIIISLVKAVDVALLDEEEIFEFFFGFDYWGTRRIICRLQVLEDLIYSLLGHPFGKQIIEELLFGFNYRFDQLMLQIGVELFEKIVVNYVLVIVLISYADDGFPDI